MSNQIPLTKVCSRCNQEKPITQFHKGKNYKDGYMTWCKECHYDYYHKNPSRLQQLRQAIASWAEKNKDYVKEQQKDWYEQHKDKIAPRRREYDKEQWANNPKVRARKNRQKGESVKRLLKSDPQFSEKRKLWGRLAQHRRRTHMKSVPADYNKEDWLALCAKYDNRCLCCKEQKPLTIDHVVPLALGGTNTLDNLQPLCKNCNSKKHKKTIDYRLNWSS